MPWGYTFPEVHIEVKTQSNGRVYPMYISEYDCFDLNIPVFDTVLTSIYPYLALFGPRNSVMGPENSVMGP